MTELYLNSQKSPYSGTGVGRDDLEEFGSSDYLSSRGFRLPVKI